jgi:hypothetical protein
MQERHATDPLMLERRCIRPQLLAAKGKWRARRRLPSFGPFGPRRRRRALNPAADRTGNAP